MNETEETMKTIHGIGNYVVEVLAYDQKSMQPGKYLPPHIVCYGCQH